MMRLKFNQKVIAILGLTALTTLTVDTVVMLPFTSASAVSSCACITSEAQPQHGQKSRSSGNFSTQGCTTTLRWSVPNGISVNIARDVSSGKDKTLLQNVTTDVLTQNPNQRNLYIANPRGADRAFQVCALNT